MRGTCACLLICAALAIAGCRSSTDVTRSAGARCDRKDDCDEKCLTDGAGYPGGFCTVSCLDDGDCPADARCAASSGGVCLFTCRDDADCGFLGQGWRCGSVERETGGQARADAGPDAGTTDAGTGAGAPDAGSPDAGPDEGVSDTMVNVCIGR